MARHVDIVVGEYSDSVDEQVAGTVAKKIYTLINGKTLIAHSTTHRGKMLVACVIWDDP